MDSTQLRVDRAEVRRSDHEQTLVLSVAGAHVLLIRLCYDSGADEMVNSAGTVATSAVNAWALIDHDLRLELDQRASAILGFPRELRLRLDVDHDAIRRIRAALLETASYSHRFGREDLRRPGTPVVGTADRLTPAARDAPRIDPHGKPMSRTRVRGMRHGACIRDCGHGFVA